MSSESVFSLEQGEKICEAYTEASSKIGSKIQQDILRKTCSTLLEEPAKTSKPQIKSRDGSEGNCHVAYILIIGLLIYIFTS